MICILFWEKHAVMKYTHLSPTHSQSMNFASSFAKGLLHCQLESFQIVMTDHEPHRGSAQGQGSRGTILHQGGKAR